MAFAEKFQLLCNLFFFSLSIKNADTTTSFFPDTKGKA